MTNIDPPSPALLVRPYLKEVNPLLLSALAIDVSKETEVDMSLYEDLVNFVSFNKTTALLSNSTIEKTLIIYKYLLIQASESISIYGEEFNNTLGDSSILTNYFKELSQTKPHVKISIVYKNIPKTNALNNFFNDSKIKFTRYLLQENLNDIQEFTLVDENALRIVSDPELNRAICTFNDKRHVKIWKSIFNDLITKSIRI